MGPYAANTHLPFYKCSWQQCFICSLASAGLGTEVLLFPYTAYVCAKVVSILPVTICISASSQVSCSWHKKVVRLQCLFIIIYYLEFCISKMEGKEKLVKSEEIIRMGWRSRGKGRKRSRVRGYCASCPSFSISELLLLSSSRKSQAQIPMDALRQDDILGSMFFITGCVFALLVSEGLDSRPQQQKSPTRMT